MPTPTSTGLSGFVTSALNSASSMISSVTSAINGTPSTSNLLSISKDANKSGGGASPALAAAVNTDTAKASQVATAVTQTDTQTANNISQALSGQTTVFGPVSATPKILAGGTFVSGAKDTLAAVDVYAVNKTIPVNSVSAPPPNLNVGTLIGLKGAGTGVKDVLAAINNTAKNVGELNKANPVARIAGASTEISGALRTLPPGCANGLFSKILGDINKHSRVSAGTNGLLKMLKKTNIPCVTGMGGLINSISGAGNSFSITDPAASIASLSGVVKSATEIGIPNVFGSVVGKITNKATINQVAGNVAPDIIKYSDIGSLNSMAGLTTPGSLMMGNPNIIGDFSRSYSRPLGSSSDTSAAEYQSMIDSYRKINPNWDSSNRNGETIKDVSSITGSSADFNSTVRNGVINTNDTANQSLLIAESFPKTDVASEICGRYPQTTFSSGYGQTLDPTLLMV